MDQSWETPPYKALAGHVVHCYPVQTDPVIRTATPRWRYRHRVPCKESTSQREEVTHPRELS